VSALSFPLWKVVSYGNSMTGREWFQVELWAQCGRQIIDRRFGDEAVALALASKLNAERSEMIDRAIKIFSSVRNP
jgi:hypothetical protein